jgi:hypothetical protein
LQDASHILALYCRDQLDQLAKQVKDFGWAYSPDFQLDPRWQNLPAASSPKGLSARRRMKQELDLEWNSDRQSQLLINFVTTLRELGRKDPAQDLRNNRSWQGETKSERAAATVAIELFQLAAHEDVDRLCTRLKEIATPPRLGAVGNPVTWPHPPGHVPRPGDWPTGLIYMAVRKAGFLLESLTRNLGPSPNATSKKPFNLNLDTNLHVASVGKRKSDFGGFNVGWKVLEALVQNHPGYCSPADLGYVCRGKLGVPSAPATIYQTISQVRKNLKPLGLDVKNVRGRGYVLEKLATPQRRKRRK